ncbi:hypothetical protein [Mucilaginibacter sp.]|uniref:hypothetical protein n=1 Tax=Mucilaginibacter sp. TaxID=1882438 RepID=UPI003D0C5F77
MNGIHPCDRERIIKIIPLTLPCRAIATPVKYGNRIRREAFGQAHTLVVISPVLTSEMKGLFNEWTKALITDTELKKSTQIPVAPNREVLTNLAGGWNSTCYLAILSYVDYFSKTYRMREPLICFENCPSAGYALWEEHSCFLNVCSIFGENRGLD